MEQMATVACATLLLFVSNGLLWEASDATGRCCNTKITTVQTVTEAAVKTGIFMENAHKHTTFTKDREEEAASLVRCM